MLKKRPKSTDEFINATPEVIFQEATPEVETKQEIAVPEETKPIVRTPVKTSAKDDTIKDEAVKKVVAEKEDRGLARMTTYVNAKLVKKLKLLAVLNDKKEYEMWNEAVLDLIEKYKKQSLYGD